MKDNILALSNLKKNIPFFKHISPYLINKRQSKCNTTKEIVLLFIFLNEQNEQSQAQIIYKPNALLFILYQSKHTSNTNVNIKFSAHGGFLEDHCLSFFNHCIACLSSMSASDYLFDIFNLFLHN
jgi:hypothetical protein